MKTHRLILSYLFILLLTLPLALSAQNAGEAMAEGIRSQVKDPAKPFSLIVKVRVKEGKAAAFEAAFSEAMKQTRKEKGCLRYDLNREKESVLDYVIYERWADLEAVKTHLSAAYIAKLFSLVGELADGAPKMELLLPAGE